MINGPRFIAPYFTALDATGVPVPGALLNFYITGSSTRANTYSNPDLTIANTNPVVDDGAGMFGNIFLDPGVVYKAVLTYPEPTFQEIWTADPISGEFGIALNYAALRGFTSAALPIVYVTGATTAADGGQGWFYVDPSDTTSLDNGGTIIVAGTLRWKRLYTGPIYPEWFGAKGDGTTDNSAAFASLIALAKPIQGVPGAVYGLATPLDFSGIANFSMTGCTFKDLSPGGATRKFLFGSGNFSVRLSRVAVQRNGTGGGGSFSTAAAIWIANCSYTNLSDIEVSGNDAGAGIHLVTCNTGIIDRAFIHDMTAGTPSTPNPGDGTDQIAGIWLDGCTGVTVHAATVATLLSQSSAYGPENINTRGITTGGPGNAVTLSDCFVSNVDEGYDLTGDALFTGWQVTSCRAEFCRKFGFKAAVTASIGRFVNCYTYRCTLDGFYLQGTNTAVSPTTNNVHDVQCIGCVAQETGFNVGTYYPGFTTSGFRCDPGSADATYPRNCWFVNCRAFGGADMKVGFNNSVGAAYLAQDRNRIVNCTVSNATQLSEDGFVDGTSILSLTGDQSIPDSTDTNIIWNHATSSIDGLGFLTAGATDTLTFPYSGRFSISVTAPFNQDATGNRSVFPFLNGSRIPGQRDIRAANAVSETTPNIDFVWDFVVGDDLIIKVNQTSGGALDVNGSDIAIRITDLNSPPQLVLTI